MVLISGIISAGAKISGAVSGSGTIGGQIGKAQGVRELVFKNRFEFPNIGKTDMLYIALDEKAVYIFDGEKNIYICVGRDYREIDAIQCGFKEE